ncbi:MAG: threonine--tRNA ligase [Minisyncoccia bacterium]
MSTTSIEHIRHTLAHLLNAAVQELYPHVKPTIGPAIDTGFYFDFDFRGGTAPGDADLKEIQKKMLKTLNKWTEWSHEVKSPDEARAFFAQNPYKIELINELEAKGETITFYTCGTLTDLCRGGHAENPTKDIDVDAFKLLNIAGAYWRGDAQNPMLTRIYGLAFGTKEELAHYVWQQEEAKKRDHRILAKQLKLFTISDLVGSGLPLFQKNGNTMRRLLQEYLWELHKDRGYEWVWTPHLAKEALYETSGHAGQYMEDMFSVWGGTSKEKFYVKPMNCPHHMQLYADNQFSYRDMPVRYFEPATVYRDEKTGQLSGLTRVRSITQDDGHIYCRVSQIEQEAGTMVDIIQEFFTTMGMLEGYRVRLSLRDDDATKWLGEEANWATAQEALVRVCKEKNLPYFEGPGEAAFYGPKLDFMFKDAIGREHQLSTIQCDFVQPSRFELSFVNEEGKRETPVVIHRAISGSLERFLGVAIEHFAGAFPFWFAPEQISIIPVADEHMAYAEDVRKKLNSANFRVHISPATDTLGKRIRGAKSMKIPYILVVGDAEVSSMSVSVESRDTGTKGVVEALDTFISRLTDEQKNRTLKTA